MDARRSQRVTEVLREELGEMIGYEMSDPRVLGATVTEVHLSPDLKKAQVQIAVDGSAEERQAAIDALEHARHFLKTELSHRLTLFRVPELHFEASVSPELEGRMGQLFKRMRKGRPRPEPAGEKSPLE